MKKGLWITAREAWQRLKGAPTGRVYRYEPTLDTIRSQFTKKLTFAKLETLLGSGAEGYITETLELFEEMEARDARLLSVAGTRRRALTGLDWEIVSAAEKQTEGIDQKLADEAAAYVRERLANIKGFDECLEHLSEAIGPNLAVSELVWENAELIAIENVPHHRLTTKPQESPAIRVRTLEEMTYGISAETPKFVVYIPSSRSGSPLAKCISRAQAWIWLYKKLAISDWGTFCEIFGMPVRVGKYRRDASAEEKTALKAMLENMGTAAWAMISEAVEINFAESTARGISPYEGFLNWLNRETAVLWTGGNLTTDTTGGTGTFAAASVQDEVRGDLRDDDIKREGRAVREQILGPMTEFKFPGREAPVPYFKRVKPEIVDRVQEAQLFRTAQQTGMKIPADWAYNRLGIKKPDEEDETLTPVDAFEEAMRELPTEPVIEEPTKGMNEAGE